MTTNTLKPKFKIGDLVKVTDQIFFLNSPESIVVGDIGIVVNIFPDDPETVSFWGIDYVVFVNGQRHLFFESEIELLEQDDDLRLIYLKK
jgi:hypothetical protein